MSYTYGSNTFKKDDIFTNSIKYRSSNVSLNNRLLRAQSLRHLSSTINLDSQKENKIIHSQDSWRLNQPETNEEHNELMALVSSVASSLMKIGTIGVKSLFQGLWSIKNSCYSNYSNSSTTNKPSGSRDDQRSVEDILEFGNAYRIPGSFIDSKLIDTSKDVDINIEDKESNNEANISDYINEDNLVENIKKYEDSMLNGQFYTENIQSPLSKKQNYFLHVSPSLNFSSNEDKQSPNFAVTPLQWDVSDEDEITSDDEILLNRSNADSSSIEDYNENTQYGTSLFHRPTQRNSPDIETEYLRKIFNNNYQPPPVSREYYDLDESTRKESGSISRFFNMTELFRNLFKTDELVQQEETTSYNESNIFDPSIYSSPQPVSRFSTTDLDTSIDAYQNEFKYFKAILEEKRKRQQLVQLEKVKSISRVKPLTSDQLLLVTSYWSSMNSAGIISSMFNIDLSVKDLKTLADGRWLNDNVIDFYFSLISERSKKNDGADCLKVFGFSTHFYTQLKNKGYAGVARWAKRKKIDVTEHDLVFIPINIGNAHWALSVINNKDKKFQYYDSLISGSTTSILEKLRDYMIEEGKRLSSAINFYEYDIQSQAKCPQQENGFDCGVFTCTSAETLARNKNLFFTQTDMKVIRRRMAYEIIEQQLIDSK